MTAENAAGMDASPPEGRAEIESVEESLAALPGLEETLDRFQDVGLEERLRE